MNNVFDIKRFGNYFLYDLRRARNNYALSLLITGTLFISIFVVFELFSLIFTQEIQPLPDAIKYMSLFVALCIVIIGSGAKLYGSLTEKRAGSDFLMLPASTLEKWLSMALVVCVVLPLVLFALQFASAALMSFFFPNTYGDRVLALIPLQEMKDAMAEEGIHVNLEASLFFNWCINVLTFTLGAVCFKKSKVAKTLLCIFGLSIVLSTLLAIFVGTDGIYINSLEMFDNPAAAVRAINWAANIVYFVFIGGLLGGLYYRLRTINH